MIKAVIFDYGNVISRCDNHRFLQNISKFTPKPVQELEGIIYRKSGLPEGYESGEISSREFYERVSELCELNMPIDQFKTAFTDKFTPIPETRELIRKLKPNYKLALLSNTNEWDFECEISKCEVFPLFDVVTLSFSPDVRAMKPREKIYRNTLNRLRIDARECVYIDDVWVYAAAARLIQIPSIQYISDEQCAMDLRRLGVKA